MKLQRCPWPGDDPLYIKYHDEEWGVPVHDDRQLFELLLLESMQAGLSWITILRRREHYRLVFDRFDPVKIAKYDEVKIASLLADSGIIRNRLKVRGAVQNAHAFLMVQKEWSTFDRYIWSFVGGKTLDNRLGEKQNKDVKRVDPGIHQDDKSDNEKVMYPTTSPESDTLSKDLKKRGFTFVGSTICYAFMQSAGLVQDHLMSCFRAAQIRHMIAETPEK